MVFGFARQSGGDVTVESRPGQGTTVRLYLPRAPENAADPSSQPQTEQPRARGETVLVLEDDDNVRELAVAMLADLGYGVLQAKDGRAAMAALEETARVDLLLSDVVLPGGLSGPDVARRAGEQFPGLKILYMSGNAGRPIAGGSADVPSSALLMKPFRRHQLAARVRQVLDG